MAMGALEVAGGRLLVAEGASWAGGGNLNPVVDIALGVGLVGSLGYAAYQLALPSPDKTSTPGGDSASTVNNRSQQQATTPELAGTPATPQPAPELAGTPATPQSAPELTGTPVTPQSAPPLLGTPATPQNPPNLTTPADGPVVPNIMESRNPKMKPVAGATGAHTTFRVDPVTGKVIKYQTWMPQTNPQNPAPFQSGIRYDGQGGPHYNTATQQDVPSPHVHDKSTPGVVRVPKPEEKPKS